MGSLSLLHGIFPTQGWNPGLPHCRWILYQLSHKGSPNIIGFTYMRDLEHIDRVGSKMVAARDWGRGKRELVSNARSFSFAR